MTVVMSISNIKVLNKISSKFFFLDSSMPLSISLSEYFINHLKKTVEASEANRLLEANKLKDEIAWLHPTIKN